MRFVEQRTFGGDGDCVSACVASILDRGLDDVPNFSPRAVAAALEAGLLSRPPGGWDPQDWAVREFVRTLGLDCAPIYPISPGLWPGAQSLDLRGFSIAGAWSPRLPGSGHAVVALDGDLIWDPHPERHLGVGPVFSWLVFTGRNE